MLQILKKEPLFIGLSMFSMFFGAGNIIFPLAMGQFAGDKNIFAIMGLILTAAVMPVLGVIAMILFNGSTKDFFGRLGRGPGFILALLIISLLGPLGSTPRCIALAYTTIKGTFPAFPYFFFSALSCALIFLLTFKKNHILTILGWVLTPLLLASLLTIILIGLFTPAAPQNVDKSGLSIFFHGLKEGYNTMDLLASFFFSCTILNLLKSKGRGDDDKKTIKIAILGSVVGAILLGLVYMGFSYLAAFHGSDLSLSTKDELLALLTLKIAGKKAGFLVCSTIALACLTTAIALIAAFSDFFQTQVLKEKVSYKITLLGSLLITFFVSTFEFNGISSFLTPILEICYPGLIVLTLLNIAYRFKKINSIKMPVFTAFVISLLVYIIT